MNLYVSSYFINDHNKFLKEIPEYAEFCDFWYKDAAIETTDPAAFWDFNSRMYSKESVNKLLSKTRKIINLLPQSHLKEWWKLMAQSTESGPASLRGFVDDASKITILRLYALGEIISTNDNFIESDIKSKKPGTLDEFEIANLVEEFFDLYNKASREEKDDVEIRCMVQAYYCIKLRYLWYPNGDGYLLDDMRNFLLNYTKDNDDSIVIFRNDRELSIVADAFYWAGRNRESIELCDYVINRKSYEYTFNSFRILCRIIKAKIYIDKGDREGAFGCLSDNISDYRTMIDTNNFKSLTAGSYDERSAFLMAILKTYDYLESICNNKFTAQKDRLFRSISGSNLNEKISKVDQFDSRHQWEKHVEIIDKRADKAKLRVEHHKTITL